MAYTFNINKDSTLPYLTVGLIEDGRHDFSKCFLALEASPGVRFSMWNEATGLWKIRNAEAEIVSDEEEDTCDPRLYLRYRWKKRDVNESGRYVCQFTIYLDDSIQMDGVEFPKGILTVPIAEDLIVNINDATHYKII